MRKPTSVGLQPPAHLRLSFGAVPREHPGFVIAVRLLMAIRPKINVYADPHIGKKLAQGSLGKVPPPCESPWAVDVPLAVARPFRIHSKTTAIIAPITGPTM